MTSVTQSTDADRKRMVDRSEQSSVVNRAGKAKRSERRGGLDQEADLSFFFEPFMSKIHLRIMICY